MKSRVFTPFLAAFAGSIILLIGLFLLQGTQTSRTILSGSSVAQAAQVAATTAAVTETTDLTVTIKADKSTVSLGDAVKVTVLVTPSRAMSTTTYQFLLGYGDKNTVKSDGKGSKVFTFDYTYKAIGTFEVTTTAVFAGSTKGYNSNTIKVLVTNKVALLVPTSAYIGQVIPFSVTGTVNAVNYTFETSDVTGGKWAVTANTSPMKPVSFPIISGKDLKITVYDAIYNATDTKTVKGLAPTITFNPSKTTASPNEVITFAQPTIKGGGKDIPGATATLLCGKDSTEATVSNLTCTILKTTGTVTANVKFTIQPPLPNDVYSLPIANQINPIVLYGTEAKITVGGVVPTPTPTITPTGKSTIKIIVGKDSLEACGDTTVITAEVKDSTGKHLPSASVIFTVTDDDKTEIRSPTDTKVPTTTHFVTNKPGNVTIKAVLKDTPAISATITQQIGSLPTGDERQCTLKAKPPEGGDPRGTDHRIDGDDKDAIFGGDKPAFKFFFFIRPGHPDFTDVKFVGISYNPLCAANPISATATVTNVTGLVCFKLRLLTEDGNEKDIKEFSEPVSYTIDLNPAAWDKAKKYKEAKPNGKVIKIFYQDTAGAFVEDSNAEVDETNLKETSTTSNTLLLQQATAADPSVVVSTTAAGETAVGVDTSSVVVDTGNKVYLPLITR